MMMTMAVRSSVAAQEILTEEEVKQSMGELAAHRMAGGSEQVLVAPYSLSGEHLHLVLTNRFSLPLDFSVEALSNDGDALALTELFADSREQVIVDLGSPLSQDRSEYRRGTIRVRYFGDSDMAQAWLLVHDREGRSFSEIPFSVVGQLKTNRSASFWSIEDLPRHTGLRPAYRITNLGKEAVEVILEASSGHEIENFVRRVPSWGHVTFEPKRKSGALVVYHDGEPGQILLSGFLEDRRGLAGLLPIAKPESQATVHDLESVTLNTGERGVPRRDFRLLGAIADLRPSGVSAAGTAELVSEASGIVRARETWRSSPGEIVSLPLAELVQAVDWMEPLRLRLELPAGTVPSVYAVDESGTLAEIALLATHLRPWNWNLSCSGTRIQPGSNNLDQCRSGECRDRRSVGLGRWQIRDRAGHDSCGSQSSSRYERFGCQ